MSRSNKKGFGYSIKNLNNKKIKKIWALNCIVLPEYVNKKFSVYIGNRFVPIKVTEDMVGYRLGEFLTTRKRHIYKKK